MKDTAKTKNILIVSSMLALLAFALCGFLFWSIKVKNEELSLLANQVTRDTKTDQALRAVKIALDTNKGPIVLVNSFFVPKDGVVDFINMIDLLGKESGTTLSIGGVSTEQDPSVAKDFNETLKLHLETTGTWQQTYYFIQALEALPYRVTLDQVTMSLTSATDKMFFQNASTAEARARVPGSDERWKGSFDITVLKLK